MIGFVQVITSAPTTGDPASAGSMAGADASKPLDPLTALMNIGQLAEKGLKTSAFAEAVSADKGLKIHVFPTPDGATVDTVRDLPLVTAADLQHAVSLLPASAEKEMVLSLIHDPQTIAAAMKASGLINPRQMVFGGQDLQELSKQLASVDASTLPLNVPAQGSARDKPEAVSGQTLDSGVREITQSLETDPATLAAQQILATQAMLPPQMPVQSQPAQNQAFSLDNEHVVDAGAAVLPPEITSGPWGHYQTPVMPDERFVRFIVPNKDQTASGPAASLLGPFTADETSVGLGTDKDEEGSVLAGLADQGHVTTIFAKTGLSSTTDQSSGDTLASKIVSLTQAGTDTAAPSVAASVASSAGAGASGSGSAGQDAPSSASSLFSSIFAKHGIASPSATESLSGAAKSDNALSAKGFSAEDFAALGLDPLATAAPLFAMPASFEQAAPVALKSADDTSGEGVRSGLLKTLGSLKPAEANGGLAAQLVNSKQILELAAEEGLTLTTSLQGLAQHAAATASDGSSLASFASANIDLQTQANSIVSGNDPAANVVMRDASSDGQNQQGGHNHAHQDGQAANQQAGNPASDADRSASLSPGDEMTSPAAHTASKSEEALLSGADAHQTTLLSDGTASDASAFSTASMATSSPVASTSSGALGARDALMAVTYAMTGRSSNGAGSAVAAEMRFMSLGQQVMAALKQNSQEIELRLNPAQLGNVVLKLQVEGQKLSISARTESQLSDDALSVGEEGLRASLAANGYQLDKFDVSHQEERRKPRPTETEQSQGAEQKSDDPFSFDLIA